MSTEQILNTKDLKIRITYRSEVYVEGETLEECRRKWEELDLTSKEGNPEFVELVSVEDADTYEDLMSNF